MIKFCEEILFYIRIPGDRNFVSISSSSLVTLPTQVRSLPLLLHSCLVLEQVQNSIQIKAYRSIIIVSRVGGSFGHPISSNLESKQRGVKYDYRGVRSTYCKVNEPEKFSRNLKIFLFDESRIFRHFFNGFLTYL